MIFDDAVQTLVRREASAEEIRVVARGLGFRRMQEAALEKVRYGLTTLDDVLRVVPFDRVTTLRCRNCRSELMPSFRCCPYCLETIAKVARREEVLEKLRPEKDLISRMRASTEASGLARFCFEALLPVLRVKMSG